MKDRKKLSAEEVIKNISKDKMTPFNKLGHSYVAIRQLVDFMQVLEKNEDDYKDEFNSCKDTEIHPSDILSHYILLEAFKFYESLEYLRKENKSLPDVPPYYDKLRKVRHKVVAHGYTQKDFSLAEEVIELIVVLSKEVTTKEIIEGVLRDFNLIKPFYTTK